MNNSNHPGTWDNGVSRFTYWANPYVQQNPFQNLDSPLIAAIAHEVHQNFDVSPFMALLMALDAACHVSQGLVDVMIPGSAVPTPISIFTMKVAGPAMGKSRAHQAIFGPLYDLQASELHEHEHELKLHAQDCLIANTKCRALQQALAKAVKAGEDTSDAERELRMQMDCIPGSPRRGPFIFEDTTSAAFHFGVYQNGVSAMLGGAEGGTILLGDALDEPQKLNAFFSGEDVRVDRKTGASYTIRGVRVNFGIAVQPDVLASFQESKRGKKAAATGFNARLIVCDATHYQKGLIQQPASLTWVACAAFHARLLELMKRTLMSAHIDGFVRSAIRFSVDAASRLGEIRCQIKSCTGKGGIYESAQDHAGRLAEIIARVAAIIHFFEGKPGDIDIGSLESANYIVSCASQDYLRLYVKPPKEYLDALALDAYFEDFRKRGIYLFDKSYARSSSPYAVRKGYDLAILVLMEQGKVCYTVDVHGYPCLQIVPSNGYVIQQIAFGRVINGQRYLP